MSIVRTSLRPLSAAESEPVNVSTMIKPKRISENLSVGSRTRRVVSFAGEAAGTTDAIGAPAGYSASSVTVQPLSGLKRLMPGAIFAVPAPRSFW